MTLPEVITLLRGHLDKGTQPSGSEQKLALEAVKAVYDDLSTILTEQAEEADAEVVLAAFQAYADDQEYVESSVADG